MDKKRGITMVVSIVVIGSIFGVYSYQRTQAKETSAKQVLIATIDKQQALEAAAKESKAGAPVVSEDYPAKIIPESVAAPKESSSDTKEIPQQSLPPLKVAPVEEAPPPTSQEAIQAITFLSEADIQRLQSYKQFDLSGGFYRSFRDMYINERADCDGIIAKFSAITLRDYAQAKAEWFTSPTLVYKSFTNQFCVRGVLSLTYYAGNKFGLTPNVKYQREVEYRLRNSVTQGKMLLKLESINYLDEFKAVK